jgi:hypothetical protein
VGGDGIGEAARYPAVASPGSIAVLKSRVRPLASGWHAFGVARP